MDYQVLSVMVALEAQRRGASIEESQIIGQDVIEHLEDLPFVDLMVTLMTIENVMRSYGYPAV